MQLFDIFTLVIWASTLHSNSLLNLCKPIHFNVITKGESSILNLVLVSPLSCIQINIDLFKTIRFTIYVNNINIRLFTPIWLLK